MIIIIKTLFINGNTILLISLVALINPPITTKVPYANSLDPDETPSNLASHQDPTFLTLVQQYHQF